MASNAVEKIVLRVLTLLVSIPIAKAVRKAIDGVWQAARPDNPPRLAGDTKVKAADAITWAALSAAGIVAGELLTRAASGDRLPRRHGDRAAGHARTARRARRPRSRTSSWPRPCGWSR